MNNLDTILGNRYQSVILAGYMGSTSHGTLIPRTNEHAVDDKDVMCVSFGSKSDYFGLSNFEGFQIKQEEWDVVGYEIRKYFRLLLKNNPNVMGLLWLRPEHYLIVRPEGKRILENRNLFSSKQAYKSFTGYAWGQLHRMTAFQQYEGYMGMKRKALVDKYGYDVKNAAHLIRLLKMGVEFLTSGELEVFRHDNNMLIEIKMGKWPLHRVQEEASRLFALADEANLKSPLPLHPDYKKAEELLIDILWRRNYIPVNPGDLSISPKAP